MEQTLTDFYCYISALFTSLLFLLPHSDIQIFEETGKLLQWAHLPRKQRLLVQVIYFGSVGFACSSILFPPLWLQEAVGFVDSSLTSDDGCSSSDVIPL